MMVRRRESRVYVARRDRLRMAIAVRRRQITNAVGVRVRLRRSRNKALIGRARLFLSRRYVSGNYVEREPMPKPRVIWGGRIDQLTRKR